MQSKPRPKLLQPDRRVGILLMPTTLDAFVEESHPVRAVWAFVEQLDLGEFLAEVKTVEGQAGRPAIDPRLLLALWLYAVIDGVDSGRKLARLCKESFPYRWLCGGLEVEYHTLNDFRSCHAAKLRVLLTNSVTCLITEGLINPATMALDGVRIRASAGSASFRRAASLKKLQEEVDRRITELQAAWERDGTDPNAPAPKRKRTALDDRKARLERAAVLARELDEARKAALNGPTRLNSKKKKQLQRQVERGSRASMTDPDARVMHMPDGGFRPAYVGQVSTDTEHGFVLDAYITNEGTDNEQLPKAVENVRKAYGEQAGSNVLADSGFRNVPGLAALEKIGVTVYTPVPDSKKGKDRFVPRKTDSPAAARWRARMATPEGAKLYRRRSQVVEFAFANFRNRALRQFRLRGPTRCEAVLQLHSIAHNLVLRIGLDVKKAA
jgi:transposase